MISKSGIRVQWAHLNVNTSELVLLPREEDSDAFGVRPAF
jgi:hypothetical protein